MSMSTPSGIFPSSPPFVLGSVSEAEKRARFQVAAEADEASPAPTAKARPRSCVTCRSRKVRCDKRSPCSNCRRANIPCVLPEADQQPRWARRLQQGPSGDLMHRLKTLENLVTHLNSQLNEARAAAAAAASVGGGPPGMDWNVNSPDSSHATATATGRQAGELSANPGKMATKFGRLVVDNPSRSRYIGSGFWSRVNDELNELEMDAQDPVQETNESPENEQTHGETPYTQELGRSPLERNSFIFKNNLTPASPDLREFHPLPSQIPFILDVFSENVNAITQAVHMPTVTKMIRGLRSDMTRLTPPNEALMFSIYYAAITSMENDDCVVNFGCSKHDLNLKYRVGLEHALAKADFLNVPDLVLVQAFINFLALLRRHDSPRFVWMMTGLAIRMAISLGLHRDGSKFGNLIPYDIEMRRRVWWSICMLDVRTSEDQGTEFTITEGSFDTKIPSNINNADIGPDVKETPLEREGLTDMSFPRMNARTVTIVRQMMAQNARSSSIEEQSRLLDEIYRTTEEVYLQYATESNIEYWVSVTIARLVTAKMTLFVYLPYLFSSPSDQLTTEIRTKLLISAIEVAEFNHALNAEQACRQWRWIYQTYVHWHAIVYILIEICRVPSWSPLAERAWVALHSAWLIPPQSHMNPDTRVSFPLQKLMTKARTHRRNEILRLKEDPRTIAKLDEEYTKIPHPSSPEIASNGATDLSLKRWHRLFKTDESDQNCDGRYGSIGNNSSGQDNSRWVSNFATQSLYSTAGPSPTGQNTTRDKPVSSGPATNMRHDNLPLVSGSLARQPSEPIPAVSSYQPDGKLMNGPGIVPWLWDAEPTCNPNMESADINMDLDDIDWHGWVDSVKCMQWDGFGDSI